MCAVTAVSIDYLGERRAIRIGKVMCCSEGCALALPLGSHPEEDFNPTLHSSSYYSHVKKEVTNR